MDNEWDAYADGWDTDPTVRTYAVAAFGSLVDLLSDEGPALDGAHVFDFGCGTGSLTEHLVIAGASVHAVDTSKAMLAELSAKIERNGWTDVTVATELPDAAVSFDLVVCSSVCAFLDDYPAATRRLAAHVRPNGRFVQWDWERTDADDHGLNRTEIRDSLAKAGLVDIVVETAFSIDLDGDQMAPLVGHGRRPSTG